MAAERMPMRTTTMISQTRQPMQLSLVMLFCAMMLLLLVGGVFFAEGSFHVNDASVVSMDLFLNR